MASEGTRIIGTESEEEKKRREEMEQNSIATSTISKVITKELLNEFLNSEEFKLKIKNDLDGDFGFLPGSNDQEVCNLTYFPSNKGRYQSIIISLFPAEANDKEKGPINKLLHVQTAAEDEESLTMMIFTLAESLKKIKPN
jgi:hypothetical protein